MNTPVLYMAHDPIGNTEAQVTEYDPALLAAAAAQGVIFIAVDADGDRQIVDCADVKPPTGSEGALQLVQPVYVDERMQAVVDVFNALESVMFPEAETMAFDDEAKPATVRAAKRDPAEVFAEKLAALREITKAGESR